jgi:hypothetical protein
MLFPRKNSLIISSPRKRAKKFMADRVDAIIDAIKKKYIISIKENCWHDSHMVEHEDGSYKCVDWGDRDNHDKIDTLSALSDPKCQFILKCQLRPKYPEKLRKFFYFAKGGNQLDDQLPRLRMVEKNGKKMYWRGNTHLHRGIVLNEISGHLNNDFMKTCDQNTYYREMATSKMSLSLPGLGPACHREFEAFAVGTPVIMPEFKNIYYVDLIPNHHYVSVVAESGESLGSAIIRRYHEVCGDDEFMSFVANNAMQYYDTYCSVKSSVKWMIKFLEL